MGLLNIFSKSQAAPGVARLPSGSFTVDKTGRILTSTLPGAFSETQIKDMASVVTAVFTSAQQINMPLRELFINYAGLRMTVRELRGGAIVFLAPRTFDKN